MWHQVADKRPVDNAECWVWRRGWKRPRWRQANRYVYPKPGWEWLTRGLYTEAMRPADWWCSIDMPPDPPQEGRL